MTLSRLLFSFRGRINRATFGSIIAFTFAVGVLQILVFGLGGETMANLALALSVVISLVMAWIHTAATTKRLHDLNKSGWWQLVLFGYLLLSVSVLVCIFASKYVPALATVALGVMILALPISLWAMWVIIQVLFLSGTPGRNTYGDPTSLSELDNFAIGSAAQGSLKPSEYMSPYSSADIQPARRKPTVSPRRKRCSEMARLGHA